MTIVFIMTTEALDPGLAGYLTTNRDDPAAMVARMAAAVRPGGIVALFYSNYH